MQDQHRKIWHHLSPRETEEMLEASARGLSVDEAERRLTQFGFNELQESPPPSDLAIFLHQFQSPLIYILLVAAIITIVLREHVDTAVIVLVLAANAIIGFIQERQAEISVRSLMQLAAPRARVIRDGREWEIESRLLVPGDYVLLESGSRVPADLRLALTTALTINESLLTGESLPSHKRNEALDEFLGLADRINMAYAGTIVVSGRGRGWVVATGGATEIGAIASQVREAGTSETPLQHRMNRFARVVGIATGVAASLAFLIGILQGEKLSEMFLVAVALMVAAVPEGLPIAYTITLAAGVRRMARRNAIIRRLPAVETLGSTSVIGSDKTGTLTENRMTVQQIWTSDRSYDLASTIAPALSSAEVLQPCLLAGVLANEAQIYLTEDGNGYETEGDPTEAALLVASARMGIEPEQLREQYKIDVELPFEPERRYSAVMCRRDAKRFLFVKGAPERVASMCDSMSSSRGPVPIDAESIDLAQNELAGQGLRLLAMAYRELPVHSSSVDWLEEPEGLVFLGMQGMMDPPRQGVREAIVGCQSAGIRVVMITGDHARTASVIARDLGIADGDAPVLTGIDLEAMDDDALRDQVRDVVVFARVEPSHKLRIVRALQSHGDVIAVTGDGVNDAPALNAADIGIAMGKSGTDVARESADMVLADDNFISIYGAVEEGRIAFDNLRKVTFFLIATNAGEIIAVLASLALGWPLPFLPAQILWLNLVTEGLQDVALAFEPGEPGVLKRPPRSRREGILSGLLWERTVLAGVVMAIGTLTLFRRELNIGGSLVQAQTVALTTMVLFEALQVANARSEHSSIFRMKLFSNPFLLIATLGGLAVHIAALYLPPTQYLLRVEPLDLSMWLKIIAVASSILVVMELHKLWRRRKSFTNSESG